MNEDFFKNISNFFLKTVHLHSQEVLKGEPESETIGAQDQALQINMMQERYYKHKRRANANTRI
jgi:hypothetical protein